LKVSKPVISVAVAVLFFSAYLFFFTGKKEVRPLPLPLSSVAATTAGTQAPGWAPGVRYRPVPTDLPWSRDPFVRPQILQDENSATKPVKTALKLEAILESAQDRVAIIDREVVTKGEMIGEERVQDIGKDRVVLIRGDSKRFLLLGEPQGDGFVREKPSVKPPGEKK
jgi:hypothetical protein